MKRFRALALLSLCLAVTPAALRASGAGLLMPSATGAQLSRLPTGSPPTFNQITTNSGSTGTPNATFISSPAVGDYLVTVETVSSTTPPMTSGWTDVEVITPCAVAPAMLVAWRQVQPGDGATFAPSSASTSGVWSLAIADVGTSLPSWLALGQQIVSNCAGAIPASVTVTGNGPRSSGVFAVGYVNVPTSGSLGGAPTMTGVTGDLQSSAFPIGGGGGGAASGIVAAYGALNGGTMFQNASATVDCPATQTNCSEAFGVLIFLNP